ncbi:MAG TPA: aldehyde dehydrogenase family protein [Chromatiales bacterium]|nr:aldehyde dehydrogenase family protein [Chromatiales bacterium]
MPDAPAPAGTLEVTAPFDGSVIAKVDTAGPEHVEQALATAWKLFRDRDAWLPLDERIGILERAAAAMSGVREELAQQAAHEGGKPLLDSRVEVARAIDGLQLCIETLRGEQGEVVPMRTSPASAHRIAFTQKEPIGVVVAVSAFNHPLNLIVHQVAAAVAAGCPVICKPAEDTPLSALRFAQILHEAGLPEAWCQVLVPSAIPVAEQLVTDARVGFFSFIGSAAVGWMLRSRLAPGTRCALEHGGVAPVIVAGDADLDVAIPALLKGGFYHAGQVCVSVQRVFVPRAIAKDFAIRLAAGADALRIGDPLADDTEVGPLIRPAEVERVHAWVQEAVEQGAELVTGGKPLGKTTYACTVLLDPPADTKVSRMEVFGPVVCVYGYDDLDDAIAQANSLPVAFQGAVFTGNLDLAMRVYRRLDASAVMLNDHTAFRVDGMPFAGLRQSGLGVGGIPHTIADMQVSKMLVIHSPEI